MSRNRKKSQRKRSAAGRTLLATGTALGAGLPRRLDASASYTDACRLASLGQRDEARRLYADLEAAKGNAEPDARLRALVHNDLAVMAVMVVASRIGGLPYTVTDGVTGLLCTPGDPVDLSRKIARLLDDPDLRRKMGLAGRKRFEEEFVWEDVIERYFRPLLANRSKT